MTRKAEEELKTPFSYFGYEPESEEEKRFLNDYNPEKWKKASHTADVAVFALSEAGLELLLVKRGGFPYKGHYCLPGGFINMDESLYETAARELEEETGMQAGKIKHLFSMYATPGYCAERLHIYFTKGLKSGQIHRDEEEFLHVIKLPVDIAYKMVMNGQIFDAKTIAGILAAKELI